MANGASAPYFPQDVEEVAGLVRNLEASSKKTIGGGKKSGSCKKTTFAVAGSHLIVDSWRFQDWDYKRRDLPTYARGLFTYRDKNGRPEIAVRGYDKFFNTGEVDSTKWENVEKNTEGPYELSLKENGCIIFISGLSDGSLLVCSKHSTGARSDTELSHAAAGEKWIDRQLKAIGKTRQDLAKELRRRNATAVAELCDDEFEEHILAYQGNSAGLYLHGMNVNIPEFTTYPGAQVQAFGNEWGFKRTDFLMLNDIKETRKFLERVAETGSYNGRDVEGFVIRCRMQYATGPNQDWFFKYKFEEPYLMYRQWRECTKALISGKQPKYKKHTKITEEYLHFAKRKLAADKSLADAYQHNHGIIQLRNDFLEHKNLKGSDIIRLEEDEADAAAIDGDIVLAPVATIGCGKTTIAVALSRLFGWGHIQNDNITGKRKPPIFTASILEQLKEKPVVFADRNNAQKREREQLITDLYLSSQSIRLVALHFVHTPETIDHIRRTTHERVFSRGDNHQNIQAATDRNKVIGIMEGFIKRFEPVDGEKRPDDAFDSIIELDPIAGSRANLEKVISELYEMYPGLFKDREMPSAQDLDDAITYALSEYKPDLKHEISTRDPKVPKHNKDTLQSKFASAAITPKKKPLEYISVSVPKQLIREVFENAFGEQRAQKGRFFRELQQTKRLQEAYHVTLIHRASSKQHPVLWQRYEAMWKEAGGTETKLGSCEVQLERIVWDNRIMAIVVRLPDEQWACVNQVPHITIGTRDETVKPKESNELLKRWLELGSGDESGIGDVLIEGSVVLQGEVKGVLSRSH